MVYNYIGTKMNLSELYSVDCFSMKIIEKEYAGNRKICIGCAQKYIEKEAQEVGRGDCNEGLIARLHIEKDKDRIKFYKEVYGEELLYTEKKQYIEIKNPKHLFYGIYCFYTINKDFSREIKELKPGEKIKAIKEAQIPNKIFDEFSSDEVCLINLFSTKLVLKNIVESVFKSYGKYYPMNMKPVKYRWIKYGRWECPEYSVQEKITEPFELWYKDIYYQYQNEKRIVILSDLGKLNEDRNSLLITSQWLFNECIKPLQKFNNGINIEIKVPIACIEDGQK